ncbi:MAG: hypothetical protein DMF77_10495 [Acidobacteria bacterium]|nr:MAG: hypothetical protein DMF77_10495 [Acidobacteriota bacterium]
MAVAVSDSALALAAATSARTRCSCSTRSASAGSGLGDAEALAATGGALAVGVVGDPDAGAAFIGVAGAAGASGGRSAARVVATGLAAGWEAGAGPHPLRARISTAEPADRREFMPPPSVRAQQGLPAVREPRLALDGGTQGGLRVRLRDGGGAARSTTSASTKASTTS